MRFRLTIALIAVAVAAAACSSGGSPGDSSGLGNGLSRSGTGSSGANSAGRLAVVAGENMWGDILRQIGGTAVDVTSIITDPSADPHEYESSVNDAAAVARARLVVRNGAGYDDFLGRLLSAHHPAGRVELTVADVVGLRGSNPNPHLWYDPAYVTTAARAFAAQLASLDPAHTATFQANLQTFLAGEQRVIDVIDQIKARFAGTKVGYTERVAGYLVQAAGLRLGTPASFAQAVEDGNDPSPLDNVAFERAITGHGIKVLIYNSQVADTMTKRITTLATTNHIPVVGMSETLPTSEKDFQTWQADQARALLEALDG